LSKLSKNVSKLQKAVQKQGEAVARLIESSPVTSLITNIPQRKILCLDAVDTTYDTLEYVLESYAKQIRVSV
jgi:hypothetical protein